MFDFLTFNRKVGIPSIVISCQDLPELKILADHAIQLKGAIDEYVTPLVYITPLYLFSYHLALKRGFDPIARRYPLPALKVLYRGSEFDQSI
jgi:glucosamine 6-phosphate synthetase-like amidotransferase/phosphosugar isomerase protein